MTLRSPQPPVRSHSLLRSYISSPARVPNALKMQMVDFEADEVPRGVGVHGVHAAGMGRAKKEHGNAFLRSRCTSVRIGGVGIPADAVSSSLMGGTPVKRTRIGIPAVGPALVVRDLTAAVVGRGRGLAFVQIRTNDLLADDQRVAQAVGDLAGLDRGGKAGHDFAPGAVAVAVGGP